MRESQKSLSENEAEVILYRLWKELQAVTSLETDPFLVQIAALNAEIAKLESERDSDKGAMQRGWSVDSQKFQDRERKIESSRQKLVALELASINSYSQQFNKNIFVIADMAEADDVRNYPG